MNEKITITNGTEKTMINLIDLENMSGYGDYIYYNNEIYTLGFSWSRKNGKFYIENIYFLENNQCGESDCKGFLINTLQTEEYKITLSNKDYKKFLHWFDLCNK